MKCRSGQSAFIRFCHCLCVVECGDYVVLLWEKFNQQPFVKMLKELVRWFSPLRLGGMGWTILPALFASQGCEEEVSGKAGGHHQCSMDLYSQGSFFDRPKLTVNHLAHRYWYFCGCVLCYETDSLIFLGEECFE